MRTARIQCSSRVSLMHKVMEPTTPHSNHSFLSDSASICDSCHSQGPTSSHAERLIRAPPTIYIT
eukprot:4887473-Amphidinium_carterae.2